jgi:ribosomal protein S18 acetylase RimI-like enzyme
MGGERRVDGTPREELGLAADGPLLARPGRKMSTVTIRRVRETDVANIRELRLRSLGADPSAFGSTLARETAYDDAQWVDRVRSAATSTSEAIWVAELGRGPSVGMIGAFTKDGHVHVYGMWVAPEHRGRGIGGRLLDTLLDWAERRDPSRDVFLSVNPTQAAAAALYRSRGFRSTGTVEPLGHLPGAVVHEMRRISGGQFRSDHVPG